MIQEPWFSGLEERRGAINKARENVRRGEAKERREARQEAAKAETEALPPKRKPKPDQPSNHQVVEACAKAGVHYQPRALSRRPSQAILLKRRRMLSQLISQGMPDEDIVQEVMGNPKLTVLEFRSPQAIRSLLAKVKESWAVLDAEQAPRNKSAAVRRIMGYAAKAAAEHKWAPVAQLEHLLMELQGTAAPARQEVNINIAQRDALVGALENLPIERVLELAAKRKELEAFATRQLPPAVGPVIDVEGIVVEELAAVARPAL